MATDYQFKHIMKDDVKKATIILERGDTAPYPDSTKRKLRGPLKVTYERFPDGEITVTTEDID